MTAARMVRLGDVATIVMGQSPPGESYNTDGHGIPLLNGPTEFGATNPVEKQWTVNPTKVCEVGDILFCVRGATAGRLNVADKSYCLGRGLAAVRPKPGVFHMPFLRHVLRRGYRVFQSRGVGSTFINISADELSAFEVPALAFDEQRRIARILDGADDVRAKRLAATKLLESLTTDVFNGVASQRSAEGKHWKSLLLRDVSVEFRYGTSAKSGPAGNPTLRIPNVVGGCLDLSEVKTVPVSKSELDRLRLIDGDILFVRTNGNPAMVGRCAVFDPRAVQQLPHSSDSFVFASYLIRMRPNLRVADPVFLREYFLSAEGRRAFRARSKTSAGQFNINTQALGSIPIALPPLDVQREFARRVAAIDKLKVAHRASLAEMDALFASLQHRAFRGEL